MPFIMEQPYPMEFVAAGDEILIKMEEYDTVRRIAMMPRRRAARRRRAAAWLVVRPLGRRGARRDTVDIGYGWSTAWAFRSAPTRRIEERFG